MTKITLAGTPDPNTHSIRRAAFPTLDDVLSFDMTIAPKLNMPYLIKFVSRTGDTLEFQGVNLEDRTQVFGSDGTAATTFTVNLADVTQSYRFPPCSLDNISSTDCYAILFLTDDYFNGHARLASAEGTGPKWPKGSGVTEHQQAIIKALRKALNSYLNGDHIDDAMKAKFASLAASND